MKNKNRSLADFLRNSKEKDWKKTDKNLGPIMDDFKDMMDLLKKKNKSRKFIPPICGKCMGEITEEELNNLSHKCHDH